MTGFVLPALLSTFSMPVRAYSIRRELMENYLTILIPVLLGFLLLRLLIAPIRLGAKLGFHALLGFLCLWLLNSVSGITGLYLPINAVTALIAGIFGVPGLGLIALLEIL